MEYMNRLTCFFLSCLLMPTALFALDLRKELGDETYEASGLDKLTSEELATLSAAVAELLGQQEQEIRVVVKDEVRSEVKEEVRAEVEAEVRTQVEEELAIPKGDDRFGLETVKKRVEDMFQRDAPDVIESRLIGDFDGWSGNTRFRLENGQIWRQSEPDTFVVRTKKNPNVTIRRGMFGGYLLKIEGYNSSVKVERVE
jgi:hypothetical protein